MPKRMNPQARKNLIQPKNDDPRPSYPHRAFESAVAKRFPKSNVLRDIACWSFYCDYESKERWHELSEREMDSAIHFAQEYLKALGHKINFFA